MHRSYLFVPGNRPERFDKACAAGADVVIVDLEDAVPPDEKSTARDSVVNWLRAACPVVVRINAADTEWFKDDLALCRLPGVAGIILPKAEQVSDLQQVLQAGANSLLPLIESARAFANLRDIAEAKQVQRLLFGSIDFQLDMGIEGEGEELLAFRSQLVLASRLAGIAAPVDGVCTAIDDAQQITQETARARRLGFGAKLCIHPKQVAHVNAAFCPSENEIAWATRIMQAAVASNGAAISVDGKMVDRPVIRKAEGILAEVKSRSVQAN